MEKYKRYENRTGFVWIVFKYSQRLFPELKTNNISRTIAMATYINNQGFCIKTLPNGIYTSSALFHSFNSPYRANRL